MPTYGTYCDALYASVDDAWRDKKVSYEYVLEVAVLTFDHDFRMAKAVNAYGTAS